MHEVTLHADGSYDPRTGRGGWAAILSTANERKEFYGGATDTSNNRMEVTAILEGLSRLEQPSQVVVVTDSQLAIGWLAQGWKRREPAIRDLLESIERIVRTRGHRVQYRWVRGHSGDVSNERCDRLAAHARLGRRRMEPTKSSVRALCSRGR
jgi:ribonuclease HI